MVKKKKAKKKIVSPKKEPTFAQGVKKTKIRVIGLGGGGSSIVAEIAQKIKKASFAAANTDIQALRNISKKVIKFQFGVDLTQGLGTGMNPILGEEAAKKEKEKIKKLLAGQDLCIFIVCLGGGTGSGAAPIFAKLCREAGNLSYGIFTLPFKFEGEKKMEIAKNALKRIKPNLNAFSVIPNERVFNLIDKTTPLKEALSVINKNLSQSLEGLIETISEPGLINIDFADLKTILEPRAQLAYLNTVLVPKKEASQTELTEKVLNSALHPYNIQGAKNLLFNIAGEKQLSLSEVNQTAETISKLLNKEAKIIFGISQGSKYQGMVKLTLFATGCSAKIFFNGTKKIKPKPRKKRKPIFRVEVKPAEVKPKEIKPIEVKPKEIKPKKIKPKEVKPKITKPEEVKIRKNALQIKEETEKVEAEMLKQEKFWETPAFLRKRLDEKN